MAIRRRLTPPSYRLHKSTGQAIVVLDGKTIYLGLYDSPQSHVRYRRELAAWLSKKSLPRDKEVQSVSVDTGPSLTTMNEVILAFVQHAQHYYSEGREYPLLPYGDMYGPVHVTIQDVADSCDSLASVLVPEVLGEM